jgi:hypothetical protein
MHGTSTNRVGQKPFNWNPFKTGFKQLPVLKEKCAPKPLKSVDEWNTDFTRPSA